MKINRYNQFITESNINELINESRLIVGNNFRTILKAVLDVKVKDDVGYAVYNLTKILINLINRDFDTSVNYIELAAKPGMVTFIPEDKIPYDDVEIDYRTTNHHYIMNKYDFKILQLLNIPTKNIKTEDNFDYDIKNSFKVIERFNIDKIKSQFDSKHNKTVQDYSKCIIYYLQNNEDENCFVAICVNAYSTSEVIKNTKTPENRRTESRIGRVIGKLLDAYLDEKSRKPYTPKVIEKFVNLFTACAIEMQQSFDNFRVVQGDDIKFWYNVKNYSKESSHGQLNNSCMRFERCQSYFDIYTKNPEVCKLLILLDKNEKLIGRCLLWTLTDGRKIMDRIYASRDSLMHLFEKWGKANDYESKFREREQIAVKVKPIKYSKYPYMDTFCYYLPERGILTNVYDFSGFRKIPKTPGSILNTLKNPKILFNLSTYKTTPSNKELLFTINKLDGGYHSEYVKVD